jgi:predicted TIM-barrel fold metal-dependent hydrolase
MNYFDANTWIGRWPFAFCDAHDARTLSAHLRRHGARRALVSPLDAVFAPEPGPANRALLESTRGVAGLEPVPVINPALANGSEELARCAADKRVRAVRLLPNYHNFGLKTRAVDRLIAELKKRGLRLIVQMQLIDARHEYHAMNLKPVPVHELEALLERRADAAWPVLASGLMRPEILRLAPKFPQLLADLSFAEWHDTMQNLLAKVSARQLVFASHTPLLITAAARAKVDSSTISEAERRAIAGENLERFLAK